MMQKRSAPPCMARRKQRLACAAHGTCFANGWRTQTRLERASPFYGPPHTVAWLLREAGMPDRETTAAFGHETEGMARHCAKGAELRRGMEHIASRFEAELSARGAKST